MPPNPAVPPSIQYRHVRIWTWTTTALRYFHYCGVILVFAPFLVGVALGNTRPVWLLPVLSACTFASYIAILVTLLTLAVWSRPSWPVPSRGIFCALLVGLYISALIFIGAILIGLADFRDVNLPNELFIFGLLGGGLLCVLFAAALAVSIENMKKAESREANTQRHLA
jgi:hypothetical protein